MKPDGSDLRRLTTYSQQDLDPAFSPDGKQIAFVRDVDPRQPSPGIDFGPSYERLDIFLMDADGSDVRRLTHDAAEESFLAWSPDGSRIAFTRNRQGPSPLDIWTIEVATGEMTRLTDGAGDSYRPSWSPDGRMIAFYSRYRSCRPDCSDGAIYVMNADGTHERLLLRGGRSGAVSPEWSPHGRFLVFGYGYRSQFDLYLARPDGAIIRRLTKSRDSEQNPEWSPDGERIVYQAHGDIFTLRVRDGTTRQLTRGEDFDYAPAWGAAA